MGDIFFLKKTKLHVSVLILASADVIMNNVLSVEKSSISASLVTNIKFTKIQARLIHLPKKINDVAVCIVTSSVKI